ncbi:MAG TPA: mandelate racemase/muconate lactonizing enzyme family protein [Acetobacteraceae bacterium]|nr:mandelate racemase/muconate lactonizing enzyme family protein [Acetobacteraceae bacterium]
MKIERVEAIPISIPLRKVFSGSSYKVDSRATVITRIHTAGGLVSEVYNGDDRAHGPVIARIIQEELAPLLIGEPVSAYERLWEKMFRITIARKDRDLAMQAIACADSAIWDLLGKALGISVCKLLGGYRDRLPIIAIAGYYLPGKVAKDLAPEMEWLRSVGMAGCKVKVGGLTPEEDAERVRYAREGGGKDFIIAVDANRGWSPHEAIRFAKLVEQYDIRWFEEPCHWHDDVRGMAEVRRHTSIPINAGQSEISAQGVRRMLDAGAVDVVNFDASESGGITSWRWAAGACALHDVQMAHHEEAQIAAHMLAAVPHGTYVECFPDPDRDPIWQSVWVNRPAIKDGIMDVPQGPGLDIRLDWDAVAKYRV